MINEKNFILQWIDHIGYFCKNNQKASSMILIHMFISINLIIFQKTIVLLNGSIDFMLSHIIYEF